MAICKSITLANGLTATDSYIRIDSIMGSKAALTFSANCYLSADAFAGTGSFMMSSPTLGEPNCSPNPQPYLEQELITFAPDLKANDNFFVQAYAYLKSLPKYVGATDC